MNWDDMRVFLSVARQESLTGAARALRIDPATAGRRIARLEERLGGTLFVKSPQGYALTDLGQRVLAHAGQAEQALGLAAEQVGGQSAGLSGQIRLGAPDGCANFLLPQVCAAIADAHPELEIQIVALPRVFNLSRREADLAIAVSAPPAGRLSVQKLTDYRLHLVGADSYLSRHPPIRAPEDLRGHRMIGYIPDMIFDSELDYLHHIGIRRVPLASNSVSVQFNWVRQGGGLGVVHDFAIPSASGLSKVLADRISLVRSFYLIRHADDRRSERMALFARLLADGVRREVARLESLT